MNRQMMRQAQELQAKLSKIQEELENAQVEATSGGGAVKVVASGHQKIVSIKISPEAVNASDVEMLEDLVMTATNEALTKSQELAQKRLSVITGGLKIPGM